jgi:hypothetical protein
MVLLIVVTVGVLGYAVVSAMQVRKLAEEASAPSPEASSNTTQPLNPSAPVVVAQTLEPTGSRAQRGTIIFDMAHSEVFGPQDTSELGQSRAVERMRAAGYSVQVTTAKITKETLGDDVVAVFLPGPMVPLADQERTVLDDFVRRGGTMIMTVHVPFPILGTPARYGLPVGTGVMVDPNAQGNPGVWATTVMKKDPITEGVKTLSVVSGWPVGTSPSEIADPRIVVQAPKGVVVDSNGDNAFDAKDPQPPYGVVGVATIGSGRVVVLGDDAILANIAIDTNDNAAFLDNLLELISAPKPA